MDTWLDTLLDWAWDANAPVCWGVVSTDQPRRAWVQVRLPDKVIEHIGPSLSSAAWCVLAEIEPDPLDRPELTEA